MLKELFDRIRETAQPTEIVEIHGQPYLLGHGGVSRVPTPAPDLHREPEVTPLAVHSLRGLVDYIEARREELVHGMIVHIESPRSVRLISETYGGLRQREVYATASPPDGDRFDFGTYMEREIFGIHLFALFEDAGDREDILRYIGTMKDEQARTMADDGFSQVITTKKGVATVGEVVIRNPVRLHPYRTFADVEQPPGLYVLRTRGGGDDGPVQVALFEVDDGQWRRQAIQRIRDYVAEHLADVTVIG